jgi:3-phosphoshikimate 1-carboxyvinyltransferase
MLRTIRPSPTLEGEIIPAGDKSISHRAVLFNSIAQGRARITNLAPGADCVSMVTCLQSLGVKIEFEDSVSNSIVITGTGHRGLTEPEGVLDAGNSATTMRLLTGLLAAQPFMSVITGDSSLRSRPMDRVIQPLRSMGANIWGRGGDKLAPLAIRGGDLHGISYTLPLPSAQLKSAVLIAGLFAVGNTTVTEVIVSRDHTERLLDAMGASVERGDGTITIAPLGDSMHCVDLSVPGDTSSAAYWLVAGAVHPHAKVAVRRVGLNPTRTGIIDVLKEMGAKLRIENEQMEGGEPIGDVVIESSELRGLEIDGDIVPRLIDEIPLIVVAACAAAGTTRIRGAAELRVKESDRIASIVQELSKLGARVEEFPDGMAIHGGTPLRGAQCSSRGDHRLAMALGIAGLIAEGETEVDRCEAVDVSYPAFWSDMEVLGVQ